MDCNRKSPSCFHKKGICSLGQGPNQVKMAPAEFESALNILKGYCFTVKLWNQILGTRLELVRLAPTDFKSVVYTIPPPELTNLQDYYTITFSLCKNNLNNYFL